MIRPHLVSLVHPVVVPVSRRLLLYRVSRTTLGATTAALVPTLVRAREATPTSDLEANKTLARKYHDEIFEQGHLEVADEILTPDFTWYAPPQTVSVVGPDAVKQAAKDVRDYFGHDLTLSADDVIAERDRVVIRWTLTGTMQTDHGAVPVVYTGIDIFRIQDGKLAELWQNTDDYGLAQQLGEIPTEATSAATPTP
jgi:predicted SnoaL-like aldol condensation-catalyzing enzyme